jgi:hypothetical protein
MGQSITVTEQPTGRVGMARFEVNRPLTGMGHERYLSVDDCTGERPPDVLARRLIERGGVKAVHIHGNQVTVELEPFGSSDGLIEIVRGLFTHYLDGVAPKSFG